MALPGILAAHAVDVDAAAAVLLDAATGITLFAKNENERRAMASTTKIMTAVIVLENADLNSVYTVTAADAAVEGSALGVQKGNRLRVEALLKALMLVSGNDTAHALANAVAGSQKAFVRLMNQKAAALGLANTHFTNPAGLSDEKHYSTALDLARLTVYALKNKTFARICSTADDTIAFLSPKKSVPLHNHNRLLSEYKGCIGVKTGYTQAAGRCLVSAARRHSQTLIAVTLSDSNDWDDHRALLDYGFAQSEEIVFGFARKRVAVVGSKKEQIAFLLKNVSIRVPKHYARYIKMQIEAPHFLYAPVMRGEEVAAVVITYRDTVIERIPLRSADDAPILKVRKNFWERIKEYGKFRSAASKIHGG